MVRKCIVPGCSSLARTPGHYFPQDKTRAYQWIEAIQCPSLRSLSIEEIQKIRICILHFSDKAYIATFQRRKLKDDAIPTLHLPTPNSGTASDIIEEDCAIDVVSDASLTSSLSSTEQNLESFSNTSIDTPNLPSTSSAVSRQTPLNKRRSIVLHSTRIASLTSKAKRFHSIIVDLKKTHARVRRKSLSFKDRLQEAEKFVKRNSVTVLSGLSKVQIQFIEMQTKNVNKTPQSPLVCICSDKGSMERKLTISPNAGRRFSTEDKILALALYQRSGRAYSMLSKLFVLPSSKSLKSLLCSIPLKTGITPIMMRHLKEQSHQMTDEKEKFCVLMWDEMPIEANIQYSACEDKIIGFEDWGHVRTSKFADHVLVFMLRGVQSGWKIPISYNFCKAQTKSVQLISCIKNIVKAVSKAGLKIVSTVCNQCQTNVTCINGLLKETAANCLRRGEEYCGEWMEIEGSQIIPIYDPPHLLKEIRNNMLNKNLELVEEGTTKRATWDIIELAYKMDANAFNTFKRMVPNLTDQHVLRPKIKKMKVKCASQIFSKTLASYISFLASIEGHVKTSIGPLQMPPKQGLDTAHILNFFNDVFDSVNGHTVAASSSDAPLRTAISSKSLHHTFWPTARSKLRKMRFVTKTGTTKSVPSLTNWGKTIDGFRALWKYLQGEGFKQLKPRHINQDPLENFFDMIRMQGFRNINPTSIQFQDTFKTLLINNLTSSKTVRGNCEDLEGSELLLTLNNFIETSGSDVCVLDKKEHVEEVSTELFSDARASISTSEKDLRPIQRKILFKKPFRYCTCCTNYVDNHFHAKFFEIERIVESELPLIFFQKNVGKKLKSIVSNKIKVQDICEDHHELFVDRFLSITIASILEKWCVTINKSLSGRDTRAKVEGLLTKQARMLYVNKMRSN